MTVYEELVARGLIAQVTDEAEIREMIDNGIMTKAAGEVEKADALLVLGASLNSPLCSQLLQYYTGTELILVTGSEHYTDQRADFVVYGRCDEFLERLADECGK